jgi:uncharacterized membrane protein (UPF0127 family)
MKKVRILAEPSGRQIALAEVADSSITRLVGLLGRTGLDEGTGIVLKPCNMIHTWFMRFAIDVLFIDEDSVIVHAVESLAPFKFAWGGKTAEQTIELPAGTLARLGVSAGGRVRIEPA